jgi:hypothetical protein
LITQFFWKNNQFCDAAGLLRMCPFALSKTSQTIAASALAPAQGNAARMRATRNWGVIPRHSTIAAASAIVTLESALCAIDEAANFSTFCVWKINFKTMR